MVALTIRWELSLLDLFLVTTERLERVSLQMSIGFDELRHEFVKQTEEIMEHQNLAVAVRTCADPAESGASKPIDTSVASACFNGPPAR